MRQCLLAAAISWQNTGSEKLNTSTTCREREWSHRKFNTNSPTYSLIHSLIYSLTHLLTRSSTHSFTHSLIHSLIYSLAHPLTHLLTRSSTHSFTHSLIHSLIYSLAHPLTHLLTRSLAHSLTRLFIRWSSEKVIKSRTFTHSLILTHIQLIGVPDLHGLVCWAGDEDASIMRVPLHHRDWVSVSRSREHHGRRRRGGQTLMHRDGELT